MDGKTWSSTDNGYNYGHTLPSLFDIVDKQQGVLTKKMTSNLAQEMRNARKFISETAEWYIADHGQFTIEPQCIDFHDSRLPKTMIHYAVSITNETVKICNACEILPNKLGLC